jgi:Flp pilus assembly protein TadB
MSPLRTRRAPGPANRWPLWRGADLRVSDAERAEVSDQLSKHFSDGRLDEATFNERLDQAMRAVTQSDLDGLLADLPPVGPARTGPARTGVAQRPPRHHRLLFLVLVIIIAVVAGQALTRLLWVPLLPWLLIALIAFIWMRHTSRHHHGAGRPSDPGSREVS